MWFKSADHHFPLCIIWRPSQKVTPLMADASRLSLSLRAAKPLLMFLPLGNTLEDTEFSLKSLQEYLGPQRASVPSVTARIRGRHAWGGVKRKREKEQFKLFLPKSKFINRYHRAAPAYLLHCQGWFSLTQHGLSVFHTICSTTQITATEINPIYSTFLGLLLTLHITYPDGEKQKRSKVPGWEGRKQKQPGHASDAPCVQEGERKMSQGSR